MAVDHKQTKTSDGKTKSELTQGQKKGLGCCAIAAIVFAVIVGLISLLFAIGIFFGAAQFVGFANKSGLKIDQNSKSITFTNPETGEKISVGGNTAVPKDFPNVPIYPGAKIVSVVSSNENPTIALASEANQNTIHQFYIQNLPKSGWKINTYDEGPTNFVNFENSKYVGDIQIITADKNSVVTIILKKKP